MDTSPQKKEITFSPVVPHCLVSHAEDAILHQEQKGSAHQPEIQSVIDVHMECIRTKMAVATSAVIVVMACLRRG